MRLLNFVPIFFFVIIIIISYLSLNHSTNHLTKLTELKLELDSGKTLDLAKFHGSSYIIRLFSSWCSACKTDSLQLKELAKRMNAPIIGIAISDNIEQIKLLKKEELPFNYIALDSDNQVKRLLNNKTLPETIIVNEDGVIIMRHLGSL